MNLPQKIISGVIILIISLNSLNLKAQVVLMHDTSVSLCSGTFYDSGGAGGTYLAGESLTLTICSAWPGSQVSLNFTQFALESNFDNLVIHEGSSAAGLLIVNATGTTLLGQTISSQGSGCLTLVFTSDGSVNQAGWEATISCTYPCQAFDLNITGANVPYFNGDTIRICQNQSLTFNAVGTYPNNNLNYPQSDVTTIFTWDFGDGSPVQTGAGLSTVTHVFPNGGGFYTSVSGIDISGCHNSNYSRNMVMISTTPMFAGTMILQDTAIIGQVVNLIGTSATNTWVSPIPTIISDTLHILDGSGVNYTTSLTQTMFAPGQLFTSVSDLQSLTMNIEHSFLGDLEVWLTCPNGQAVNLIGYYNWTCATCIPPVGYPAAGNTQLGEPCDITPATSPGIGYTYNWTPVDTTSLPSQAGLFSHSFTDQEGNAVTSTYIPAGNYAPETPFTNFIGCPLNGDWTIHITDHLGSDDGYLFYWMLNFNPLIIPPLWSFGNSYDSLNYSWSGNGIVSQVNGIGTATPTVIGDVAYTFSVTDDFGCTYDTTLLVFVRYPVTVENLNENLNKVVLNPNPVTTNLNVKILSKVNVPAIITIYNMQGVAVKQISTKQFASDGETVIDLKELSKGIYGITVVGNNINFSERFVKL